MYWCNSLGARQEVTTGDSEPRQAHGSAGQDAMLTAKVLVMEMQMYLQSDWLQAREQALEKGPHLAPLVVLLLLLFLEFGPCVRPKGLVFGKKEFQPEERRRDLKKARSYKSRWKRNNKYDQSGINIST